VASQLLTRCARIWACRPRSRCASSTRHCSLARSRVGCCAVCAIVCSMLCQSYNAIVAKGVSSVSGGVTLCVTGGVITLVLICRRRSTTIVSSARHVKRHRQNVARRVANEQKYNRSARAAPHTHKPEPQYDIGCLNSR
jgi:hypothetical protein